ncbi:MAG: TlpA disulfide reductase family protein [Halieaceae bacterium]|nr:TlpA disulfide reductase family protein [Halieaceae bacterium]
MSENKTEGRSGRTWPAWTKWVRDVVFMLFAFWAVDTWQTRNMLDADSGPIAELTLVSLEGHVERIAPDAERTTLLYFFAPWCSVCRLSMGNLESVDQTRVRVVAVALDYANQTEVEQFLEDIDVQVPTYLGTSDLKERFVIEGYPSYYVFDQNFEIQGRTVGYSTTLGMWLRTL